ncbi:tyrosine-type recombinase/integrase [Oricola sp.]|uniref:tyrosine-type recombinase/integrase n=1 Tax=Oricola sp. TaxID=1979950 RepID=UPI003BABB954
MPRKNLTTRFVETVKVDVRTDFWDDIVRGLVLRVSPSGVKSWTAVYVRESDGAKRRLTIGQFPAIKLEKARAKALKVMSSVSEGEDPAGEKRARREAMKVRELGQLYLEKYAKRRKRTWEEDQRILEKDVYPLIGGHRAVALRRRDVIDVVEAKAETGRERQAGVVLAVVRRMFNWAVENDYLESSPVQGVKAPGKPVRRDRVLSDAELKAVLLALPGAPFSDAMRAIVQLLALTGQRSGEVCGMTNSEIDIERAIWTIPAHRTKNGLQHTVPLSGPAADIIAAWFPEDDAPSETPLFSRTGDPIESNAVAAAVRKNLQLFEERWMPHDLRRTAATGMAELRIQPHIVEAALNHISGFRAGVAGVYNRARYDAEKRRALDAWASHVDGVVSGRAETTAQISQLKRRLTA